MKDLKLLVWITQLGLTVAAPLGGFIILGIWLQRHFGMGKWVIFVFSLIGIVSAVSGLRSTLRLLLDQEAKHDKEEPVSFNSHD